MTKILHENPYKRLRDKLSALSIDCDNCCGLCCIALYFAKSDGFPSDKTPGEPCRHLTSDFRCAIHSELTDRGLKGCRAYDCFGAGPEVRQRIYRGMDWKTAPELAEQMFRVFLIVRQIHQMRWYLAEAGDIVSTEEAEMEIRELIVENEQMTQLRPDDILALNTEQHRIRVNRALRNACQSADIAIISGGDEGNSDFMGKDFQRANLDGRDFSMALLIAANLEGCSLRSTNFLGADLRDANLKNTNLSKSIFLTQGQINGARGNENTILPQKLAIPAQWKK